MSRALIIALGFAIATSTLILTGVYLQFPGTAATGYGREVFVTLGSSLTGPVGASIIGIAAGLFEPTPERQAEIMISHVLGGLFISLAYWQLIRRARGIRELAAGWAGLIAGYFVVTTLAVLLVASPAQPAFIRELSPGGFAGALLSGIPQMLVTMLVTGIALLALPAQFRFPAWRRGEDFRNYVTRHAGAATGSRQHSFLAIRLTVWFLLLSVLPLMLVGLIVRQGMTASLTEQESKHVRQVSVALARAIGENDEATGRALVRSYAQTTGYDIATLTNPPSQEAAWETVAPSSSTRSQLEEQIRTHPEGEITDADGGRILAFAAVTGRAHVVVVSDGTGALGHKLHEAQRAFLLSVAGCLLLISVTGGVIIWLYVGRPLRRLAWAAGEVEKGRFDVAIDTAGLEGELRFLADRFNTMTHSLSALRSGLEGEIADRRATEVELRESERRFREFADLLPQGVFEAKLDGTMTFSNAQGLEIFRLSLDEVRKGMNLLSLIVPEDHPRVMNAMKEIAAGIRRSGTEYTGLRTDGTRFPLLVYSSPVIVDGNVVGLRGLGIDLTERNRVQEALRSSEEKFAKAFQISPDSVNINRLKDGLYLAVNEGFTRLTGYTAEDVAGKSSADIHIWVDAEDRARLVRGLQEAGEVADLEARFRRKDGTTLVGLMSARTIDIDGETWLINITRDITERKRAEEALGTSLREKELLLKEVHHRVKNNLQVISSLLNLQASTVDDGKVRDLFRESQDRIRSMALVHESLYKSGDLARVDFRLYLDRLLASLFNSYRLPGVTCRSLVDNLHLSVDVAIPCGLIINELATNALKHAFPHDRQGCVSVVLRSIAESTLELEVADNGIGLPAGAAAEPSSSKSLGLHLVRVLADQLGGTLEVDGTAGARFRVEFRVT